MKAIDIAHELILEAQSFNTYGPANLEGMAYQDKLLAKFQAWKQNSDIFFDAAELSVLKAIIAGDLIKDEFTDLTAYPAGSDIDLPLSDRIKKRVIHALNIAKYGTLKGSFNCEIATLVLCLALVRRVQLPVELLNFSGVRDDGLDTKHQFFTIGCPEEDAQQSLGLALFHQRLPGPVLTKTQQVQLSDYVVCDAYHQECYPLTEALSEANQRLARYDDIAHDEPPAIRRFLYIKNSRELYDQNHDIQQLCAEVLAQKGDTAIKQKVLSIFRSILLATFKTQDPAQAFRRAAATNKADYLRYMLVDFGAAFLNSQDDNPLKRNTALHLALEKGYVDCARALIDAGVDLDIANANGQTARTLIMNSLDVTIKGLLPISETTSSKSAIEKTSISDNKMITVDVMSRLIMDVRKKFKSSNDIVSRVRCPHYFNRPDIPAELVEFKGKITLVRMVSSKLIAERFVTDKTPMGGFAMGSLPHSLVGSLVSLEYKIGECGEGAVALALAMTASGYEDITFLSLEFKNAQVGMERGHQVIIANLQAAPEQHDSVYDFIRALPVHAVIADPFLGLSFTPVQIPELFRQYVEAYGGIAEVSSCYHFTHLDLGFFARHILPKVMTISAAMPEALYAAYHQKGVEAYQASQYMAAKKSFEMAIAQIIPQSNDSKLHIATTWYSLGSTEKQLTNMDRAKAAYATAYQLRRDILGEDDLKTQKARTARDAATAYQGPGVFAQTQLGEQDQKNTQSFLL